MLINLISVVTNKRLPWAIFVCQGKVSYTLFYG